MPTKKGTGTSHGFPWANPVPTIAVDNNSFPKELSFCTSNRNRPSRKQYSLSATQAQQPLMRCGNQLRPECRSSRWVDQVVLKPQAREIRFQNSLLQRTGAGLLWDKTATVEATATALCMTLKKKILYPSQMSTRNI